MTLGFLKLINVICGFANKMYNDGRNLINECVVYFVNPCALFLLFTGKPTSLNMKSI